MRFRCLAHRSVLIALLLGLASAPTARADVWLFDVLTLKTGAAAHDADAYVGALGLIARRHGGVRADGLREIPIGPTPASGRIVGLWRFGDVDALDSLLADPAYRALEGLRDRTFDPASSQSLDRVRARFSDAAATGPGAEPVVN